MPSMQPIPSQTLHQSSLLNCARCCASDELSSFFFGSSWSVIDGGLLDCVCPSAAGISTSRGKGELIGEFMVWLICLAKTSFGRPRAGERGVPLRGGAAALAVFCVVEGRGKRKKLHRVQKRVRMRFELLQKKSRN